MHTILSPLYPGEAYLQLEEARQRPSEGEGVAGGKNKSGTVCEGGFGRTAAGGRTKAGT